MQDRRQLCFILGLVGGIFSLGTGLVTALFSTFVFSVIAGVAGEPGVPGLIVGLFGWFALAGIASGVLMVVGSLRMREAQGERLRSAAVLTLVGGCIGVLGANLLGATMGIVAGALLLAEPARA